MEPTEVSLGELEVLVQPQHQAVLLVVMLRLPVLAAVAVRAI
jgi:hypothetical protein